MVVSERILNGVWLRVGFSWATMPTFANDLPPFNEDRADKRVGRDESDPAPRQ